MKNIIQKKGFTMIEVLIVIPIVLLSIGVFISAIVSMTGEVLVSRSSTNLAYEIQDALNKIEQDVSISNGFQSFTDTVAPQGYNNDNEGFSNITPEYDQSLILISQATTTNPLLNSLSKKIFIPDTPNACNSSLINENEPLNYTTVYFVKNNILWRRIIAQSDYETAGCETPWQQASCAPEYVNSTYPFCKTQDVKLVEGIQDGGFTIDYYPGPNSSEPSPYANNPSFDSEDRLWELENSKTVLVTITAQKTVAGKEISHSLSIRASRN